MPDTEHRKGVALALCAYFLWGIAPLYFKLIDTVAATEILLHRVIWSFLFMLILMYFIGGFSNFKRLFNHPKQLAVLCVTSVLIAGNWLLFIWAVNNDHMLDASLGYFINPLLNVLIGLIVWGERLQRLQWIAVGLALTGVLVQLISFGSIPLVSLALAGSFSIYGLLRKKVNVDAKTGLLVETAILLPIALIYIGYQLLYGDMAFFSHPLTLNMQLMLAGVVTSIPLLCFAGAAIRIPFSVLGFFQYIGPSLMFIIGTMIYQEPFNLEKGITFGFIWAALLAFTSNMYLNYRKTSKRRKTV
ncbi:EamA family transporter RarD [Parashewanella spongiae]|uniref:EamA family transporter RarD n=1 Tax=Parashewanella spongiae TaxID=342950 RepID=A0A3A6TRK3_9GAMM|nr:EamA family transporter RarD [Parashewanella spongiae]MCL1077025.1 EamA family transporter RarD [Parashewanella spongiae]RJY18761.1 EamA family transporter RarD [Parashewanella spongiae]